MRCGCISLGNVQCDDCNLTIGYMEHYLVTGEGEETPLHLCLGCAQKRGLVHYRQEKGGQVVTFFEE